MIKYDSGMNLKLRILLSFFFFRNDSVAEGCFCEKLVKYHKVLSGSFLDL